MRTMLLQAAASGLALGLIYAGLAAGFALALSTARLINLAHGEFVLVGGYILYLLSQKAGWPWPAGLAAAAAGGAILGGALAPLVRRLPDREVDGLLLTLGFGFILQNLLVLGASATYRVIPGGSFVEGVRLGPVIISRAMLIASLASAAGLVILDRWLRVSWTGLGLTAVSQSRPAAASAGIPPARMETLAFLAGGVIAASAGALVLLTRFLTPGEGPAWTLLALAVAFLAGRPSAFALAGAGIALGIAESLATVLVGGGWREVVASACILGWLLARGRMLLADA